MTHPFRRRSIRAGVASLLCLGAATLIGAGAAAQSRPASRGFIWSIERDGRTSWLIGSLHVLTPDAYPLPASMEQAFSRATTLIEETDVNDLSSPDMMAAVATRGIFLDGQSLETVLPRETYTQLMQRLAKGGLPAEMVKMMRPWMAEIMLTATELAGAGFDPQLGIDVYYRKKAVERGMKFTMLESVTEQLDYLSGLSMDLQVAQLRRTVEKGDSEMREVRSIAAAWRAGDGAAIERLLVQEMKESPASYQSIVVARNRSWIPRVEQCLATGSCFIVVGAAHMVGTDGLIAMLRQKGYKITQQ
jgi:uncharacterized protein